MEVLTVPHKDIALKIMERAEKFKTDRGTWDGYWDEIAHFFVPKRGNVYGEHVKGSIVEQYLFDSTSIHACETLASSLHAMLSNPATKWFGFTTGDEEKDRSDTFTKWNQTTVSTLSHLLSTSNFHTEASDFYLDIASFGTAVFTVEEDDVDIVRYKSRPIYDYYIAENASSFVDTVYYEYMMTCKQIIEKFPQHFKEGSKSEFKDEMMECFISDPNKEFEVLHAIEPRVISKNLSPEFSSNMPFRSTYILKEKKMLLADKGFKETPYIVARWSKISSERYGRSPAMKALPHVKTLNALMKMILQSAQLAIAPPLQAPDEGVHLPIDDSPHAINYYRAGSKDRIEPIFTGARPDIGLEILQDIREEVRKCFYVNQLQLAEEGPRMTATEVLQRTEEKLRLFSPLLGRLTYEWLAPLIDKTFKIAMKKGILEAPPDDGVMVRFTSQIAKSQKSIEADNFAKLLATIAPLAEQNPDVLQNIDANEALRVLSEVFGVHHAIIKDREQVAQEQKAAQEGAQQQALMENAAGLSQAVKNVGDLGI